MRPSCEEEDLITKAIIGKAISIHRVLGPQLLSYLRLTDIEQGLLVNFHTVRLVEGIKRLSITKAT